jgi:hypothetical protein
MSEIEQLREEVRLLKRALELTIPDSFVKVKLFEEWESLPEETQRHKLDMMFETEGLEYVIYAQNKHKAEKDYYQATGKTLDLTLIPHLPGELWSVSTLKMLLGYTEEKPRPLEKKPVNEAPFDL